MTLFLFILCMCTVVSGIGVLAGALVAGPNGYDKGRRDERRMRDELERLLP